MLGHVVNDFLNRYVDIVFYDALVNIPNDALDDAELLKQLATSVQNLLREHVLFTVDPEVRESLLSGVEDFSEVAQCTLFVEYFVSFGELFTVVPRGATGLVDLAESFNLIKEPLTCSLTVLRIQVVLLIWPLLQMVAHHDRVFQEQEV